MLSAELKKPALKFLKSIKDKTLLKRISDKIFRDGKKLDFSEGKMTLEDVDKVSVFSIKFIEMAV